MPTSSLVERTDWGLHVRLQGTLTIEQRDAVALRVESLCAELAAGGMAWNSLIEFDRFKADGFRPDIVVALMRLARRCGHQRSAVVMTDWHWASIMADAMISAGTDDQVRIFVQADGAGDGRYDSAMDWVLRGGVVPLVSKAA